MCALGVGVIGCGNISTTYFERLPLFRHIEVRGIADLNQESADRQGAKFDLPVFGVDTLLERREIELVVNLTVPSAHAAVTEQILRAGKHAYSEKPLTLSLEDANRLGHLAAARNLRIGAAPDTFLGGAHQHARALIDEGSVGQIISGTAHVMSHGMEAWHPNPAFFFQPGGGPILDLGPYYITNLVQLLGPVRRVAALTGKGFDTRTVLSEPRKGEVVPVETPTNIHALLDFASGAAITLSASWDVWAHGHGTMELYGTGGSLFLPDPNFFGGDLKASAASEVVEPVAAWDHPFDNGPFDTDEEANYRGAGVADMARAIEDGVPNRCGLELAAHCVEVMTAILRSGELGAFEEITSTCLRPAPLGPEEAETLLR